MRKRRKRFGELRFLRGGREAAKTIREVKVVLYGRGETAEKVLGRMTDFRVR